MATRMLRRGLPRGKGGEAWPPATEIEGAVADTAPDAAPSSPRHLAESTGPPREEAVTSATSRAVDEPVGAVAEAPTQDAVAPVAAPSAPVAAPAAGTSLRRGLPRAAGG